MASIVKNQHYIPRLILRGHAVLRKNDFVTWQFDKKNVLKYRQVAVNNICAKRYLYEFKDKFGVREDTTLNEIEKKLKIIEDKMGVLISKLRRRERLNVDDIQLCYKMMYVQMIRMPDIIDNVTQYFTDLYKDISKVKARNSALFILFIDEFNGNKIQMENILKNYGLNIFYTNNEFIISEDVPVVHFILPWKDDVSEDIYIFPVASDICIALTPVSEFAKAFNSVHYVNADFNELRTEIINKIIFDATDRFVYSKSAINLDKWINL